jgi:hypothetical protein
MYWTRVREARFRPGRFVERLWPLFLMAFLAGGCAGVPPSPADCGRRFEFQKDTFAFANELVWEYGFNEAGRWTARERKPAPDYTLHCFVLARSAKQFFEFAHFDPRLPRTNETAYRRLVKRVVGMDPRHHRSEAQKVVIPGFADLRSFSAAYEPLFKAECGSAWQSYFQRGHWRMILPFSRQHQERQAAMLFAHVQEGRACIVHLVDFPRLEINHAVVAFGATRTAHGITFEIYDPNSPGAPGTLTFESEGRSFVFPYNKYFRGGKLDAYEVYHAWQY